MRTKLLLLLACLIAFVSFGCRKTGLSGLVVCEGVVTLDSEPVEGVTVALIPNREEADTALRNAIATTDASGRFTMTTLKEKDGVFPGKYWVMVTKYEPSGEFVKLPEIDPETGENIMFEKSANSLPAIYENYRRSKLEVTIPASGLRDFVLELVSKD